MRLALLVVLTACEMDAPAPAPPPLRLVDLSMTKIPDQIVDVVLLEWKTERPLAGISVQVQQPCMTRRDPDCHDVRRATQVTRSDGIAHFELPWPQWYEEPIEAPTGYATGCPFYNYSEAATKYGLDSNVNGRHVCHLVPTTALVVQDKAAAIRAAKREPELKRWLATHKRASVDAHDMLAAEWQVYFESDGETLLVLVDAIDGSSYVMGRWE